MHPFINRFSRSNLKGTIKKSKGFYKLLFLFSGFFATIWFLIRVIPKPSRVSYPCMKASMPLAYAFIAYIVSITGSIVFFRKAYTKLRQKKLRYALFAVVISGLLGTWAIVSNQQQLGAVISPTEKFEDPLGPNVPIGEAKGIFPGRVVWVWDPEATNESLVGHEDNYWEDEFTDMDVVDEMFSNGIQELTEEETDSASWDAIFKYFNLNHGKGEIGYTDTETIFIKINAVTAWGGAWPNGNWNTGGKIEYDSSPQMILAMLRQLVNEAGVPQNNIYIADPLADIYNHIYNYLVTEFPDVNYCTQYGIPNRYELTFNSETAIHFADEGSVMPNAENNSRLFAEMRDADYILNTPTMKGHRWAGVTFLAKNHFGSNTYTESWHMHPGLINNDNNGMRTDYNMYRVLVELMGSQYLGRKTLLYCMEGLWATSYEHQPAQKFLTTPFNNDYCSSLLFSLDQVAIESVSLDILQKEFTVEEIIDGMDPPKADRWIFVQFAGIDDYLHQAASSDWWPDGISYDPDNSGTPLPSLGVHEHWNNTEDMLYSRNLETDTGIELVKVFKGDYSALEHSAGQIEYDVYPNPFLDQVNINLNTEKASALTVELINLKGEVLEKYMFNKASFSQTISLNLAHLKSGLYILSVQSEDSAGRIIASRKIYKE